MTSEEAIKNLKELLKWYLEEEWMSETVYKREAVDLAISALSENNGGWNPITYRPMTEDELKDYEGWIDYLHPEETMILDCHLPDSGAEVLITSNGYVGIDTFYNEDGDCYFESTNIDEVTAWMPLPKPYEEKTKDWVDKEMAKKYGFVLREEDRSKIKTSGAEFLEEVGGEIGSSCEKFIRQMTGNEGSEE